MFFDALIVDGEADRTYSAADLAAAKRAYYDDGVLSGDALAVTTGGTMNVTELARICGLSRPTIYKYISMMA